MSAGLSLSTFAPAELRRTSRLICYDRPLTALGSVHEEDLMRKLAFGVLGVAMAAALALPAYAADPVKITGELIDVMCGATKKGPDHKGCADSCAKRGEPVAVFAKDGMYVITGK